jgi:hypothetical protein
MGELVRIFLRVFRTDVTPFLLDDGLSIFSGCLLISFLSNVLELYVSSKFWIGKICRRFWKHFFENAFFGSDRAYSSCRPSFFAEVKL